MKRLFILLLIPIAYVITWIASSFPSFTESFLSLGIYKYYSQIVGFVFGLVPISVAEVMLVGGVLTLVGTLIFSTIKSIKNKTYKPAMNYLMNVAVSASIVYFLFVISCGVNYYRYNFEHYYDGEQRNYSTEELQELCEYLILTGGEIRESIEDFDVSVYEISDMANESFSDLSEQYSVFSASYSKPKPITLSPWMSYTKITGFFFPFTFEANVNVDVPKYQIAATMLHEKAHQYGFMREDEANFISYLSGKDSEYDVVRYSVYMMASVYAMNSLYSVDRDAFSESYSFYSEKQLSDKAESSAYWEKYRDTVVAETFTQVNDTYLKANGQTDGVVSYGKVTELLLMDYFS